VDRDSRSGSERSAMAPRTASSARRRSEARVVPLASFGNAAIGVVRKPDTTDLAVTVHEAPFGDLGWFGCTLRTPKPDMLVAFFDPASGRRITLSRAAPVCLTRRAMRCRAPTARPSTTRRCSSASNLGHRNAAMDPLTTAQTGTRRCTIPLRRRTEAKSLRRHKGIASKQPRSTW
jgi:hypothetical protein